MFTAMKEGVFEPAVAVEYTDNEVGFGEDGLGQGRVVREEVKIVAEAYRIRAVAFETPAETAHAEQEEAAAGGVAAVASHGSEISGEEEELAAVVNPPRKNDGSLDFGRRRVGDSAIERFTLRNR